MLLSDLKEAILELSEFEQKVIYYRFLEDMTQKKIAEILDVSQMKISRTEKAALAKIKEKLVQHE